MLLTCPDADWVPICCNLWGSGSCFGNHLWLDLVLAIILGLQHLYPLTQVEIMAKHTEHTMTRAIRVLSKHHIGSINPSVGLFSFTFRVHRKAWWWFYMTTRHQVSSQGRQSPSKDKFDNIKRTEQKLKLAKSRWWDELWVCMQSYIYSWGIAFSRKEVTWILKSTKKHSWQLKVCCEWGSLSWLGKMAKSIFIFLFFSFSFF